MKDMLNEFRDFLFRGNIIELAVAVVIAIAFGGVIMAVVEGLITPIVSLVGIHDFSGWYIFIGNATFQVGRVLNALLNFVIVAGVIYFVVLKPMERILAMRKKEAAIAPPAPTEAQLLADILAELKKRPV